jgi:hypothetical protein
VAVIVAGEHHSGGVHSMMPAVCISEHACAAAAMVPCADHKLLQKDAGCLGVPKVSCSQKVESERLA